MIQLTKNFNLAEFLISRFYSKRQQKKVFEDFNKDPQLFYNVKELSENLQVLRDYLKSSISINISYRPVWYEIFKGRSGKSQHCKCKAVDITAKGYTPLEVYKAIEYLISIGKMKKGGLGKYNTFTHYDTRGYNARWDYTK